jgi:hypothetical protein
MKPQLLLVTALLVAFGAYPLLAESTDCTTPVIIVPDGRTTQSTFPGLGSYWYGIYAQAGHSYSVEFAPPADNYVNTQKVLFVGLTVFGPNDALAGCHGTSSVTVTQTSAYAPVILKSGNGAGRRASFFAQTAGLHLISITNTAVGGGNYSFRAVDTTLFNLRWSTWGGYVDQWGFLNHSDMPITGTFTLYDATNSVVTSVQFTVAAGGEIVRGSHPNDLNVPPNRNGFAIFTHNGPPGALIADAYMISPTGAVVTYTRFEGMGSQ